ncbi:MAG: translation initiation factor IF-2 [Candidatus Pacebacteria bacterium]|nr:translation initiation factor IF-2 [Candidatus Paceibacterota bacterium]
MKKTQEQSSSEKTVRPPVVVVMGHIDHGKSTLLDYIRKTSVVDGEAGGITQHLSAYEVHHKDEAGKDRTITFLDTPGHEAFKGMRNRGAQAADIAILVVSAEDSVKAQTLEAFKTIQECNLPFVVAINKIDKPNANPEKVKMDLAEKGIYVEGFGGDVPYAQISAKAGTGIDTLLETILLVADMNELSGNPALPAEGIVIESHRDARRGITATLIVRDGTLKKGMFIACGKAVAGTRIMEDFHLKPIDKATLSQPVGIVGWSEIPPVGEIFTTHATKVEAEKVANEPKATASTNRKNLGGKEGEQKRIPIIVRTDTAGTADAVVSEIEKLALPSIGWKILVAEVGTIGENDIRMASVDPETIIVGFNAKLDARARDLNEQIGVQVQTFDIIYKLSEYLAEIIEQRRPRVETLIVSGVLKCQKFFSKTKDRQVVGGTVQSGEINVGNEVRILRRENEIGRGTIVGLEQNRAKTKTVTEGNACGALIECRLEISAGDMIEAIKKVIE